MHNIMQFFFKKALHMICLVNLVIFFNVHSIKFSEICFKNKLFELINMAIIKNMRFAVCHQK